MKLTKKEKTYLKKLLIDREPVSNHYIGTGKYTKKGADHAFNAAMLCHKIGLVRGRDFELKNVFLSNAWTGEHCVMTYEGRQSPRLYSIIEQLERETIPRTLED